MRCGRNSASVNTASTPGQRTRRSGVDFPHQGVGVGTAHERGMAHAGKADVVDEPAGAGQEGAVFQPRDIFSERAATQAFCPASACRRLAASSAEMTMF